MIFPALLHEQAPAKINLTLHVLGRRQDGYHALESLVAFADIHDHLTLTLGPGLSLTMEGPTAPAAGDLGANLVLKAARAFSERFEGAMSGAFHLTKRLPVAAGIGGGSSDAAAALRLLACANGYVGHPLLWEAARAVGADVPVCLEPRGRMMRGAGEKLGAPLGFPALPAVLVNPGVAVETRAVFSELGLVPGQVVAPAQDWPREEAPVTAPTLQFLRQARNDLTFPAIRLAPVIADVLNALSGTPECQLARMSGSGSTCFGLFATAEAAGYAATTLRARHPAWWVKATMLS